MNEMVNFNQLEKSSSEDSQELDFSLVLASSVHDMKNSLGMLLSSLEEVIDHSSSESEEQHERFSVLQYEAERINTELVQLLSLYRFQHQSHGLKVDENFVYDTIEDQVARNDVLFKMHNIELDINCDDDLVWYYDCDLIGSVVHNVLVNGARYATKKINIKADVVDDALVIDICDDGKGFPARMIDAASLDSDAHRDGSSTQLGLFFAAKIAQLHQQNGKQGFIQLFNCGELGGGVFRISIP